MEEVRTQFDKELENADKVEEVVVEKPRPFLVWRVNDEEYKLKLTTSVETSLEQQLDAPLMNAVLDDGIPAQNTIISIIQGAMQKFHHGIKSHNVAELVDAYIEEGHTKLDLMKEVIYPLMYDAGFFTKGMLDSLMTAMDEIDTQL